MKNCKLTMRHILLFVYILMSDNKHVFSSFSHSSQPRINQETIIRLSMSMNNNILAMQKTMEAIQEENRLFKNQVSDYEKQMTNINIALTQQLQMELRTLKEENRLLKVQLSEYEKQITNITAILKRQFQTEVGTLKEENRHFKELLSEYITNINLTIGEMLEKQDILFTEDKRHTGEIKDLHSASKLLKEKSLEYEKQISNINVTLKQIHGEQIFHIIETNITKGVIREINNISEENKVCKEKMSKIEEELADINDTIYIPEEPKKVEIEVINSTSMFVTWRPPEGQGRNGMIRGYYVYFDEINELDEIVDKGFVHDIGDGNRNEAVITNLKPDTRYAIQVAGYTCKSYGKRSKKKFVMTTGAVPSAPRNLSAVLLDDIHVHLTWSKPKAIHGTLRGYRVIWNRKGESPQMLNLPARSHGYISDVLDNDATYEFSVNAKNDIGNGERASAVVITPSGIRPHITLALKNQSVAEEEIISFVCKASGSPPLSFRWEREGKKINIRRNRFKIYDMSNGSVLRIEPVRARDNTSFTCVAENGQGPPAKSTAHLRIYTIDKSQDFPQGYPRIVVNPELKSVEKDKSVVMRCEADANDEDYSIEWLKDGRPVDLNDHRLKLIDKGSLQIERIQASDYGKYECVASNHVGVMYSYAAVLYIRVRRAPPHFTIVPKREEVHPNSNVNLTCAAVGEPMPLVKWRYGAIDLREAVIGKNVLQLKNITESKRYTCVALSYLGKIEHTGEVIVKG